MNLRSPTLRTSELGGVALCAAVVAAWVSICGGSPSIGALIACEVAFFAFYLVGSLAASWRPLCAGILFDLPLRLLVGYVAVNTALFVLAWVSPFGIVANLGMVLGGALAALVAVRPACVREPVSWSGLWVVGLSLVAATSWCQDSLRPFVPGDGTTTVKTWLDGYYHTVHIRTFGAAHGAASIDDFRMAGVPARLYHYAAYLTPAFVRQAAGIPSFTAFSGIMVPLGIFFTGLGAYVLFSSFWGGWSGVAACAALLLLPDGAQQGMRNTFMSYHWMAQISPGATVGLAVLAVAWLFVLRGCLRGSPHQIGLGWLIGGAAVFYKAQFFIASALLLFLAPPLFLRGLKLRLRIPWLLGATAIYIVAIVLLQRMPGVPLIRLDASTTGRLLALINSFADPGPVREFFTAQLGAKPTLANDLMIGAPYLVAESLGGVALLFVVLAIALRGRLAKPLLLFPLLLMVNFLVMALGLALDTRGVATPEELQHRPFIWVYFVWVAWVGGAAGWALVRSRWLGRFAKPVILGLAVILMVVPAVKGHGIQNIRTMPTVSNVPNSNDLLRATEFMRTHGHAQDLFQDSSFDANYLLAAFSDRRPYVEQMLIRVAHNEQLVARRTSEVQKLMLLATSEAVLSEARRMGIRWFLLRPGQGVNWPAAIVGNPAFTSGTVRVYRFD
jgi:hypothetical protein